VGAGNTPRTQKQTVWNGSRNSTKVSHGATRPLLLLSGNTNHHSKKRKKFANQQSLFSHACLNNAVNMCIFAMIEQR